MGMINVSDGICAIDNLVFKNKKYSLEKLSEAVKNNFVGYEEIRNDILKCNKYGQNSDADSYAIAVAEILQKVIRKKDHANRKYSPSLHTLTANVDYGLKWGAGYDGRLACEPFAKNAAPSDYVRKKEPTFLILSAAKLPQNKFFGGQPIDLNFSTDIIRNHKKEISALISTYFQFGGLQLQVNSMTAELLKAALEKFGGKIAVGVDLKDGFVAIKGWTEQTEETADAFFQKMEELGVQTVICTDISKDGAMQGTNRALYRELSQKYKIDLIASGGVSSIEDIEALRAMDLYGAIIGKAYYIGAIDLAKAIEVAQ
jgi:hypothetical protein